MPDKDPPGASSICECLPTQEGAKVIVKESSPVDLKHETAKCPIQLKPMAEWVGEEDKNGLCRECLLGPVVQWYRDTLQENKKESMAAELSDLTEAATPLQLCEKLDTIKGEVEESLRERLLDFDCAAQTYEPE
jgi:hypothetical protein